MATADRQLAPWEEITYFNDPKVTTPNIAGGGIIVEANPQRVVLVISNPSAGTIYISPAPFPSAPLGIPLASGETTQTFYEKDDATLCTCRWYLSQTAAVTLHVIEVILREWPDGDGTG